MKRWLGLDCGGTFIKAGLYDGQGRELAVARQNLPVQVPEPGYAERDMTLLWQQAAAVIREVLTRSGQNAADVAGLGISAQGKGLFLLDKERNPLGNGILSSDRRALSLVHREIHRLRCDADDFFARNQVLHINVQAVRFRVVLLGRNGVQIQYLHNPAGFTVLIPSRRQGVQVVAGQAGDRVGDRRRIVTRVGIRDVSGDHDFLPTAPGYAPRRAHLPECQVADFQPAAAETYHRAGGSPARCRPVQHG